MRFLLIALFAFVHAATGANPEKIEVFRAGEHDYQLFRIPGIIVTAKATVLAYCEARRSGASDWGAIDLMLRRSIDGGKTWGDLIPFPAVPGPKAKNPVALERNLAAADTVTYNNPVLIAERSGLVHALFCLEYARCFSIRSEDDGVTWSAPLEITESFDTFRPEYDWKVLATGPGHGIQLRSGRLVVPVWLSTGAGEHAHRPSVSATIYSDDAGKSWHRGEIAVPHTAEWQNPSETAIAELADGSVMLNTRSESRPQRRLTTTSPDGATAWSKPRFDDALFEPVCAASLIRLGGAKTLVFANPDPPAKNRERRNLVLKLSEDNGLTWPVSRVLEEGKAGYRDLAVLPDSTVLCLYERSRADAPSGKAASVLTLSRVSPEWLRNSAD